MLTGAGLGLVKGWAPRCRLLDRRRACSRGARRARCGPHWAAPAQARVRGVWACARARPHARTHRGAPARRTSARARSSAGATSRAPHARPPRRRRRRPRRPRLAPERSGPGCRALRRPAGDRRHSRGPPMAPASQRRSPLRRRARRAGAAPWWPRAVARARPRPRPRAPPRAAGARRAAARQARLAHPAPAAPPKTWGPHAASGISAGSGPGNASSNGATLRLWLAGAEVRRLHSTLGSSGAQRAVQMSHSRSARQCQAPGHLEARAWLCCRPGAAGPEPRAILLPMRLGRARRGQRSAPGQPRSGLPAAARRAPGGRGARGRA